MRVVCRIQAHPSRAPLLVPLAAALAPLPTEIVFDPGGPRPSAWRTYRACLEAPTDADWLLVIQDDAQPCPGFGAAVAAALPHAGSCLVALFTPATALATRNAYWEAERAGDPFCCWACGNSNPWVSVVALAWPTSLIPGFLAWYDENRYGPNSPKADDHIVGLWSTLTGHGVIATVPSLVEHPDDVDSILRNENRKPRRALSFASEGASGIDWSR